MNSVKAMDDTGGQEDRERPRLKATEDTGRRGANGALPVGPGSGLRTAGRPWRKRGELCTGVCSAAGRAVLPLVSWFRSLYYSQARYLKRGSRGKVE